VNSALYVAIGRRSSPFNHPGAHTGDKSDRFGQSDVRRARKLASTFLHDFCRHSHTPWAKRCPLEQRS
jgi:hypothetical protein